MRVLVVEDSTAVQCFHKFALGMFKEMVLDTAMDGVAAIKLLAEHQYDVVLLDINLPLMDGVKVLSSIKRAGGQQSETPVIMVTSEADAETDRRVLDLGAFKILHKPVAAHEIRDAVTEALNQPVAEPPEQTENRRAPRLRIELTAMLSSAPSVELMTYDISPYGAFLITDEPLEVGTSVMLSIEIPHLPEPVAVTATVAHRRTEASQDLPAGFGVSFDLDSPEQKSHLEQVFLLPEPKNRTE